MAEKRSGRTSRPNPAGRRPRDPAPEPGARFAEAEVERAVAALEQVMAAGRASEIPQWTAVLWQRRGVAERVLRRRLAQGATPIPGLLLDVLAGMAERRAAQVLREVAADADMPDLVRLEARRRCGWPAAGGRRARAAFLRSLREPAAALHALTVLACGPAIPEGEACGEVLGYLLALPASQREAWAAQAGGLYGMPAAWLLRALLAAPDRGTRAAALEQLLALRDRGAVAAMDRLARGGRSAAERAAAAVAANRLSLAVLHGPGARRRGRPAPWPGVPAPPLAAALLSSVDGQGRQSATIMRSWTSEVRLVVQFSADGGGGLAVRAGTRTAAAQADQFAALAGRLETGLVAISLPEARAFVAWAVERSIAAGRLPPPRFALWEPFLWDDLQPRPTPAGAAPLAMTGSGGEPGVAATAEFLASPPHASWRFGIADLAPALRDVADAETAGPARQARLLERLCAPPFPGRIAERLRRQAWVLDRLGAAQLRDVALGSASGLEAATPAQAAELPLPRGMLARSLMGLRAPRAERGR